MPILKTIDDADFGRVVISTRRGMRQVIMRLKPDGLYVNAPYRTPLPYILEVVEKHRIDLLQKKENKPMNRIDFEFTLKSEFLTLKLCEGNRFAFRLNPDTGEAFLLCPKNTDFDNADVQTFLRKVIERVLKRRAAQCLPFRLKELADSNGLKYDAVRITGAKSRWGSCSSRKAISLSCYTMLLPRHLADYVMLHELAHLKEMNHSPKFWAILDRMTGGHARELNAETRKFNTSF